MYKLEEEDELIFSMLFTMDGNDSLKRVLKRLKTDGSEELTAGPSIDRVCKAAQSCMRLLCIVQSRMWHRAAFVSLSSMYPNLAYSALKAVSVDSGIRWEEEVWKLACFGSIMAIAAQRQ
jgi:hypothetical protein